MSRSAAISPAISGSRCSALSRSSSARFPTRRSATISASSRPGCSSTPSAWARDETSRSRVLQRRQRHPPDAVGVGLRRLGRRLEREPRLPGSARPRQRQKPRSVSLQEVDDLGQLALAAEERRRRHGEVRPIEAPERREGAVAELVDALGRGEVLEAVLAEIDERVALEQRRGRRGDEDLPAVAGRRDPRCPVDVTADVALVRQRAAFPCAARLARGSVRAPAPRRRRRRRRVRPARSGTRRRTRRPACPPRRLRGGRTPLGTTRRCSARAAA